MMAVNENMTELLTKIIKNAIIDGEYQIGDKLLPLRELATKYQVSRSVVNSAISTLAAQGFVTVTPRHFVVVDDYMTKGPINILIDVLNSKNQPLKLKLMKDALEFRKFVEIECVRMVIRGKNENFLAIDESIRQEQVYLSHPTRDINTLVELDLQFHRSIIHETGNSVYKLIHRNFEELATRMIRFFYQHFEHAEQVFKWHATIHQAIVAGNEELAVTILNNVLDQGARYVLNLMK